MPKTPEGKTRSARNATRHGLLSRTIVLSGENRKLFERLLADFTNEFQPATPVQNALVENMAVARWRQMRIWSMEKEELTHEMRSQQDDEAPVTRAALAFRSLSDNSRSLDLLNRYETRYDRQFSRALARLLQLKGHVDFCQTNPDNPQ